jgi:hypothetical protein
MAKCFNIALATEARQVHRHRNGSNYLSKYVTVQWQPFDVGSDGRLMVNSTRDDRGAVLLLALGFLLAGSLIVMALLSWTGSGLFQSIQASNSASLHYAAATALEIRMQDLRYNYQDSQTFAACPRWPLNSTIAPPALVVGGVSEQISVYCSIATDETSANSRTVTFQAVPTLQTAASGLATAAIGSTTLTLPGTVPPGLNSGMILTTTTGGFPAGSVIVSIDETANTLTLSQAATSSGQGPYTFVEPYVTAVVAFNDVASDGSIACSASQIQTCGQQMTIESWDSPFS